MKKYIPFLDRKSQAAFNLGKQHTVEPYRTVTQTHATLGYLPTAVCILNLMTFHDDFALMSTYGTVALSILAHQLAVTRHHGVRRTCKHLLSCIELDFWKRWVRACMTS